MFNQMTQEYLDDVLVRLAHHSSAIEGNTISLNDTISILINDTIPGSINKREFFEIDNHKQGFLAMQKFLNQNEPLSIYVIKDIHKELMDHLDYNRGNFKETSNAILGADFETASPKQTPILIDQWVKNLEYLLNNTSNKEEKLKIILEKHIEFERIHPFSDGNGRTGRMLINYSLLSHNLPPLVITKDLKAEYLLGLRNQDSNRLVKFLLPLLKEEKKRLEAFSNKTKTSIVFPGDSKLRKKDGVER